MNHFSFSVGFVLLAAVISPAAASQPSRQADVAGDAVTRGSRAIEEVVVTASRRSESVQDIPIAVTAYGGERLQDAQIDSLTGLAPMAPNVQISGAFTNANVAIRGIGNAQVVAGSESGVALHVDGAFLGQPLLTLSTFLDIERVEILRGPQGTLFGRNATGGAINLIPATPTETFEYGATVAGSVDPGEFRSSGYVSGPLNASNSLLGRLAYQQTHLRGFTSNQVADGPGHLDGQSNYSVRGQLEWLPSLAFSSRLAVEYQKASDDGPAAFLIGTPDPAQPLPPPLQGQPVGSPDSRRVFANVGERDVEALALTSTSIYSTEAGDFKALLYYNTSDLDILQDGDGTGADFTTTSFANSGHQYFAELIYTSDSSRPLSYVLGANYFFEALEQEVVVPILGLPVPVNLGGDIDTTSYAVFASAKAAIGSRFELFGGIRFTRDEKKILEFNNFVGTLEQKDAWREVTYELGATVFLTDDVSAYLKHNTGFKGGGFSAGALTPAFAPETNSNIEAGLKGRFLDGTLLANVAAFHMEYDDLQVNQVIDVQSVISNAAEATIKGAELELQYAVTDRLRIEAVAAWLDASFDRFESIDSARPGLGLLDLAGNRLPVAPRASGSLGVYYTTPLASGDLTYGARYDWKTRLYFSEFNLPISSQASVGTLDLSLTYRSSNERWTGSVFALNATDETIRSNVLVASAIVGSLALAQYEPGRRIGASLSYRF